MVGVISPAFAGEYEDAQTLLSAQKWAEALPILKKLSQEEPNSVTIAQDLAQVLLRMNRREEALELLRKHKLVRPAEIAARSFLSKESFHFYQQGLDWLTQHAYTQACERFDRALEKDQGHLEILFRLAQCEILDGSADLALKSFDQLERIHGKTPETTLWRSRGLALRGKTEEAITTLSTLAANGKTSEPNTELISLWWGEALLSAGQKANALNIFESDAKKFPGHLQTSIAALKIRLAQAESPNQLLAIERDLLAWDKLLEARVKEKPKKGSEFVFDPIDFEAIQRAALDLRTQLKSLLPAPSARPSIR